MLITDLLYIYYKFTTCLLYSMMSFQDYGRNPVYQMETFGYQQRLKQELDCELTLLSYNAGTFIEETPWNYGIFVQEFSNKVQNQIKTGASSHNLYSALIEIPICKSLINYSCFTRHLNQRRTITIHQKRFPNIKSHIQNYPHVFEDLKDLYTTAFNLDLVQHDFHENENNEWTLMANTSIIKIIPQLLFTEIVKNNILFNKTNTWTQKITYGVHALVQKYRMKTVNTENINIIVKAFKKVELYELAKNKKLIQEKLQDILNNYNTRLIIY